LAHRADGGRIFERQPPSPAFAKGLLCAIAGGHLVFGWGAYYSSSITWLYQLWPVVFAVAALSCLHAATSFQPMPVSLAGALTVTAYASRATVILVGFALGRIELAAPTAAFGVAVWMMMTVYAAVLWLRAYGPLARQWSRHGR
jgi:hypothetical protein